MVNHIPQNSNLMNSILKNIILLLCLLLSIDGYCLSADSINVYYIFNPDTTVSITARRILSSNTKYRSHAYALEERIEFPDTLQEGDIIYAVTTIADSAFYKSIVKDIKLSNNITTIGNAAFSHCDSLTRFHMGESEKPISYIGYSAFYYSNVKYIYGNRIVNSIQGYAFAYCRSLQTISENIIPLEIGYSAFQNCNSLKKAPLHEGLTKIGESAFRECYHIDSIMIPSTVINIAFGGWYYASFEDCNYLKHISVHPDNPIYDSRDNCQAIIETSTNKLLLGCVNTIIPQSVKIIGERAFYKRWSKEELILPVGVAEIKGDAFKSCAYLKSVKLPNSITKIGESAFSDCQDLTTFIFPKGITKISDYVLYNDVNLQYVYIPEGVSDIGFNAFDECKSLRTIILPGSIKDVDSYCFDRDDSLVLYTPNPIPFRGLKKSKNITQIHELNTIYYHPFSIYFSIMKEQWREKKKYDSESMWLERINDSIQVREADAKITKDYIDYWVVKKVHQPQIGRYNADLEIFPITDKTYGTVYLSVPYEDWQYVKQNWGNAQFNPTYLMVGDKIQYEKLIVRMPNNKEYYANSLSFRNIK